MKGWQIFRHSFNLVMANLDQALRLSLVLYLVQSAYTVYSFLNPPEMMDFEGTQVPVMSPEVIVPTILLGLLAVIASLWIAVAWHRFALTGESAVGWVPRFHGSAIMGYLGRSIMIGLLVVLGVIVVSIPVGIISIGLPPLAGIMSLILIGLAAYLFFRLGIMLPAAALGEKLTLGDAWDATKGQSGTILTLALIVVGASIVVQLPSWFNDDPGSVINIVYSLVVNWFATIIGISVLTTLYGHFVENRPID
ncbi:hypothetical protein [Marivita geojedonensis]|uniref:Membrane protein n=1 Tax=Marivita geojedonensis TaxID=1123756 RepID=A0A1X4NJY4_9RHOB|nr:hypothetical protein [Marivita geojedonensis]OSQ49893.1 membrane protein [Marivita geojedonensis]PRY76119.1 hypothetical protein CLV76_11257 [Marivita geojedonensis]